MSSSDDIDTGPTEEIVSEGQNSTESSEPVIQRIERLLGEHTPWGEAEKKSGTEMVALLQSIDSSLNENTIRVRLSRLSNDPLSSVTKLDGRNGYFQRDVDLSGDADSGAATPDSTATAEGRALQNEEKFRSLIHAWLELQPQEQPIHIEHTRSKRGKEGLINKWKFPDLLSVEWKLPISDDADSGKYDWSYQSAMQNLGEPVYALKSIELKPKVSPRNARNYFFQSLSNSRWAHKAQLLIAQPLEEVVADELRRLGSSYGLTVAHFNLSQSYMDSLPNAGEENDEKFKNLAKDLEQNIVVQGKFRESLDWDHIYDLASYLDEFRDVFSYIKECCDSKRSYSFETWKQTIQNA